MANFRLWIENEWGQGDFASYDNDADESFWGNVGAGVLPIAQDTGRILLNYRSAYVNEPHTWGVWGGKVDFEDGDYQQEAQREFIEESGYAGSIRLIPSFVFRTRGFEYHNFIGVIPKEFEPKIDRQHQWETESYQWFSLEELANVEPKHFGLSTLLQRSWPTIEKLTTQGRET